jgi:hypothetical protein
LLAHGQWYSPGTPASSTTKTGRHDIVEILLKVALNTINQSNHLKESNDSEFFFIHSHMKDIMPRLSYILLQALTKVKTYG